MPPSLRIEAPLEPDALRVVRQFPQAVAEQAPDAILRVGNRTFHLEVKYRARVGAAEAWEMVRLDEQLAAARKLVFLALAERTTEDARRILEEHGIAYVDAVGNAHIDLPGTYVHVERPKTKREPRDTTGRPRLAGKAGVAAQALLLDPAREWRVTDLAETANISLGQAYAVLDRLEDLRIVEARGGQRAKARHLVDPAALLDTWAEENRDHGVHRLSVYFLPPGGRDPTVAAARRLRTHKIDYALTGVAAAARLAPFLTTIPAMAVWIDEAQPLQEIAEMLKAEPADRGANLVLMQAKDNAPLAFAHERDNIWFANIFRIYHDARRDPKRGREQAEHLRREIIGW